MTTATIWELADVECDDGWGFYLHPSVRAGDIVRLSENNFATITQAGLDCDCGKMVLCPLNPQTVTHVS
jgi:hypothetical protein